MSLSVAHRGVVLSKEVLRNRKNVRYAHFSTQNGLRRTITDSDISLISKKEARSWCGCLTRFSSSVDEVVSKSERRRAECRF